MGPLDFQGMARPIQWLTDEIQARYVAQEPHCMVLCSCGKHGTQLPLDVHTVPGMDFSTTLLPSAYGKTQSLIPEMRHLIQMAPRYKAMPTRLLTKAHPLPMLRPKAAAKAQAVRVEISQDDEAASAADNGDSNILAR